MIVEQAALVDQWVNVGDGNGSLLFATYAASMPGLVVIDDTHQPDANITPSPNAYQAIVKVTDSAHLDQIEADGWPILWREVIPEMP